MKLAILSCAPNAYSTRRFMEAALQRDHKVKVLNTLKFAIDLERGSPDLYYQQRPLSDYDAVLQAHRRWLPQEEAALVPDLKR